MVASRPGSAARRRGAAQEESPVLGGALFIPAPLTRPKSALSLRVRSQLSHVKGMATMVSSRTTDELTTGTKIEDLTTGRLVLDRDSEAAIDAAVQEREREMRDIMKRRQHKYNRDRLVSDRKEDTLAKMLIELEILQSAEAKAESVNKFEALAHDRLQEVNEEVASAESAMGEAAAYTETLRMMTQRLVDDITNRRKLQNDMDLALGELRRELSVLGTHQRVIADAERDAYVQMEKLEKHLASRRELQEEQVARRKAMAVAFTSGGGTDGKDLVAEAQAKLDDRQQRMRAAHAQQAGIRWTLDNLKNLEGKMHTGSAPPEAEASAPTPAGPWSAPAPIQTKKAPVPTVGGRKVNLPFSNVAEAKRLSGAVPQEAKTLRSGTLAQYMRAVHARTGVTDAAYVLRRLHHWVRTEKNVQGQSASAQRRYEVLRREQVALAEERDHVRAVMLLERGGEEDASRPATPPRFLVSEFESASGLSGASPGGVDEFGPSETTTETNEHLEAVTTAKARLFHIERLTDQRTRRLLDAASALNNLVDRLRNAAPTVAKDVRAELTAAEKRPPAFLTALGDEKTESDAKSEGEDGEEESAEEESAEEGSAEEVDEASAAYEAYVKQVPRKLTTCELVLERLLESTGAALDLASNAPSAATQSYTSERRSAARPASAGRRLSTSSSAASAPSAAVSRLARPASAACCAPPSGWGGVAAGAAEATARALTAVSAGLSATKSDATLAGSLVLARSRRPSLKAASAAVMVASPVGSPPAAAIANGRDALVAAEPVEEEGEEEETAVEACVHALKRRGGSMLRRSSSSPYEQPQPGGRPLKRAVSHQQLGSGGVLDRLERKSDSAHLIQREKERQVKEQREKERAVRDGRHPKPLYQRQR